MGWRDWNPRTLPQATNIHQLRTAVTQVTRADLSHSFFTRSGTYELMSPPEWLIFPVFWKSSLRDLNAVTLGNYSLSDCAGFLCVPSMFDSLKVKFFSQHDGGEVIAKRKGDIARWCLKESVKQTYEPMYKNRI